MDTIVLRSSIGIVGVLAPGNDTVRFVTNVQDDLIFFDINDSAFDYLSMYCIVFNDSSSICSKLNSDIVFEPPQ